MLLLALRLLLHLHPVIIQLRLLRAFVLLVWLLLGVPAVRAFQIHQHVKTWANQAAGQTNNCIGNSIDMPRCCTRIKDEFKPSYASVLVHGPDPRKLEEAVTEAETKHRLTSCFTAWCPKCYGPYLLTTGIDEFPSPSAHHTHQLLLLSVLRESGALFPGERVL
jgi:hypothetical protein